jgi:hypothetical protein
VSRQLRGLIGLGLIAVVTAACGTTSRSLTPSASITTLMAGWERHFTLEWTIESEPGGGRALRCYVYNGHGDPVKEVRLLALAFDPSGAVVGQSIVWVPAGIGGFGRAYFEVSHLPLADTYKVSVWAYTFSGRGGGGGM